MTELPKIEEPAASKATVQTKKAMTIAMVANKGGVGKTRIAIFLANSLAACGYRCVVIDMDFNNSTTNYYLRKSDRELAQTKNIFDALSNDENDMQKFILPTEHQNVWFIPSSRFLCDIRTIEVQRLNRELDTIRGKYDYIIIDCQPNYDNLTQNAINSSNLVITPILKDSDSLSAAIFLERKIAMDTSKINSWYLLVNGYNKQFEEANGGEQKQYIDIYKEQFKNHLLPVETWLPWTKDVTRYKDYKLPLSDHFVMHAIKNKVLFDSIMSLCECLIPKEAELVKPEAF